MRQAIFRKFVGTASFLLLSSMAFAGGPLNVCNGVPTKFPGAVTLNYDKGPLGSRLKADADTLVDLARTVWNGHDTSTVSLLRGTDLLFDVSSVSNLIEVTNSDGANPANDALNPLIYDSDGSIIDSFIGTGSSATVLGFGGSIQTSCDTSNVDSRGFVVINGTVANDTVLKTVVASEIGRDFVGLDHTQLDSAQGLAPAGYPLMYPDASRTSLTLHEDDLSALSALYPSGSVGSVYGQVSGYFTETDGITPVRGANLWAKETTTNKVYSIVSDYLKAGEVVGTGYFKLLLPTGTYTLNAEAIRTNFRGDFSSVGPYTNVMQDIYGWDIPGTDYSFQPPLYVNGIAMTPVALGNGSPVYLNVVAGCVATAVFNIDGTGGISGGTCPNPPAVPIISSIAAGPGSATISFTPPAYSAVTGYTATCTATGQTTRTGSGSGSPIIVTHLTAGIAYSCSVTAQNGNGSSSSSASILVTATPAKKASITPILMLLLE